MPSYADLNTSMKSKGQAALQSFDKTINIQVNSYINMFGYDNVYGARMRITWHATATGDYYHRFEFVNADDSHLNNYLNSGIYTGGLIYDQHVTQSIYNCVKRCMDVLEGRIGNVSVNFTVCHQSCHSSCHTSRGRR